MKRRRLIGNALALGFGFTPPARFTAASEETGKVYLLPLKSSCRLQVFLPQL
jgi:hypothetical protein